MISFVKLSSEKDTILNNVINEKAFIAFVKLIGWAIKSGNPCWAENCGAANHVRSIIRGVSDEETSDVLKILEALPFNIYGTQFRDDLGSISASYNKEIFGALFGEDKRFCFVERNCLAINASVVFNTLKENLAYDLPAMETIMDIQEEIKFIAGV